MATSLFVLARTLHIGSAMLLVALPFFLLVTLKARTDSVEAYPAFYAAVARGLWIAWIAEALSGIAWFWLGTAQMSGQSPWEPLDPADLEAALWQTQFGHLWIGRAALGIALAVALGFASRKLVLVIASALLGTLAWAGHATSGVHFHALHLGADVLHLLIGAIWPMGLIPMGGFLWYLRKDHRVLSGREIKAVQRFSKTSLLAVLAILATGVVNGWLMIGSWSSLATTTYGELLLAKVAIAGFMIGLGGFNRFQLLPRVQSEPTSIQTLRRTVLAESALAAVVLLIVGIMGMTAPP